MLFDQIERLLPMVQKPARYSGGEYNQIIKDAASVKARFAFCFPDTYEVGMSHLGMKILYHALNSHEDYACERVFAPWTDMEALMREHGIPLFSAETRSPVSGFDLVGFTLQYEMSYTNILNMLDLAGIPLLSKDRRDGPFVIAGGPCAYAPEPLADFVDVFVLGDGEDSIVTIMDLYAGWKASGEPREAFLLACAGQRGMYVPSFYQPSASYGAVSSLHTGAPDVVKKCMIQNIDEALFPDQIVVPYTEIVHDRIMLEIARGCTKGCRFCQAGYVYRPVRERAVKTLLKQAEQLVENTGYEEISLSSLSSGDYSCLSDLTAQLVKNLRERRVNVSLPSLRIDSVVKDALADIGQQRKSSLTFAPEAGTQRLRDVINKNVTHEDLMRSVGDAFEAGYTNIKLYFMIGLPTETMEDLDGIAQLAADVRQRYFDMVPKESRRQLPKIGVSASVFVPKPHTAFQWFGQDSAQLVIEKQNHLRTLMKRIKGVDFSWHEPHVSVLEAAFARGDRALGKALLRAHELGCRFDGWSEQFRPELWRQAFDDCGLSIEDYAQRQIALDDPLPWDHIYAGISKEFLLGEWENAQKAATTPDCRNGCLNCGILELCKGECPTCAP